MVKFIESELILLKKEVDEMWTLVYNQLDRAGEAVMTLDKELAQQVMVRERRVNAFELKIDSDIEDIIALYNPVAIDLRFVLAMLKINTNLERLGDFAEGIARFVIRCKEPVLDADLLTRMRRLRMFADVICQDACGFRIDIIQQIIFAEYHRCHFNVLFVQGTFCQFQHG